MPIPQRLWNFSREVRLDAAQLHGEEASAAVAQLIGEMPVFKAFRVGPDFSPPMLENYPDVAGFLFDAADGAPGNMEAPAALPIGASRNRPREAISIILAGGLTAENVAAAILQVRPYGVDVASGVESAPGTKDHAQLREFIREARRADQQLNATGGESCARHELHSQIAGVVAGTLWAIRRQVCARNADGSAVRAGARLRNRENRR